VGQTNTTVDITGSQKKRATQEHLEKEIWSQKWTAGFKYSWRKMEATAQDRTGELDGE